MSTSIGSDCWKDSWFEAERDSLDDSGGEGEGDRLRDSCWDEEEGEDEEEEEEEEDEETEEVKGEDEEAQTEAEDDEGNSDRGSAEKEVEKHIWEDHEDKEEDQSPNSADSQVEAMLERENLPTAEVLERCQRQDAAGNSTSILKTQGIDKLPRYCSADWLPVSILRLNKQVYNECVDVLYGQNTFIISSSALAAEGFFAELPEVHRRAVRHIEFRPRTTYLDYDDTRRAWHRLPGFISKQMHVRTVTLWVPKDEAEALLFPFHWHSAWALVRLLPAGKIARLRIYIAAGLESLGILETPGTEPFLGSGVYTPRISCVHMPLEKIYAIQRICCQRNENKSAEARKKFIQDHRDMIPPNPSQPLSEDFIAIVYEWATARLKKHLLGFAMKLDASSNDDKTIIVLTKPTA
ncbi:MAG: hypothetical protein LQ339_007309 [Xanthoria mediterranea]|nr:MAG: hypothetical protein LQ339_007309 [Xanthoria mediterranea]